MAKKQQVSRKGNIVGVFYPSLNKGVEVDLARLSDTVKFLGLAHGIGQKLGDAESGGTAREKYEMASRIRDNLYAGEWELTTSVDNSGEVVTAVSGIKGIPEAEVEKALEGLTEEERKAKVASWRSNPKVKAAIAKARADKAAAVAEEAEDEELDLE